MTVAHDKLGVRNELICVVTEVTVVRRWTPVLLATALVVSVTGLASGPAYASAGSRPVLSVGGEVTTPAAYTAAQLAVIAGRPGSCPRCRG